MRQMAAPSGRPPRPGSAAKGRIRTGAGTRPLPFDRPRTYAAIDLGTNNCRLLIARPQDGELVVIDAFSRIVRLGEGLHHSGRISEAAMDRTVAALSICADKLRRRHVTLSRAVATEACRRASNGAELAERVKRETGIALDIISAAEEARLAALGCHNLMEPGDGPALIFDIGGGSTELMHVDISDNDVDIRDWISVPWGVVSLTEYSPLTEDSLAARQASYARMREVTRSAFADFAGRAERFAGQPLRLLGTSGTVTTLASVFLDLPRYDRRAVDGLAVPAEAMRGISRRLAEASLADRAEIACIGRERADLVVAGCAILESIIDLWPAARVGVADRGIREGILRTLARQGRDIPVTRREFRK
ncbi:Ppx/GppA family phosphatase [Sphingopyxis sp. XHP0097]|jgi:exopolyphosphatase/guanosine-5'-triphosphate,3'-diphosphate pyrophosphatase|uniref:Ppx/GppA family phosphatase n=1 Tax=Sphingopyxis jiangsuensis TaxID=2871171 RepID=A0ABS7MHK1_9SPHN|nr:MULTISPECIES: Ppx/GppA phosphatase family protein [Sphingopyxis]MBL0769332.1 Ppx/GppA family phosphatase [Sphingopyxis lutea]MBY4637561.1 Ppx/GppA family phosphatase [Sphingopyxis jiangsuensis]